MRSGGESYRADSTKSDSGVQSDNGTVSWYQLWLGVGRLKSIFIRKFSVSIDCFSRSCLSCIVSLACCSDNCCCMTNCSRSKFSVTFWDVEFPSSMLCDTEICHHVAASEIIADMIIVHFVQFRLFLAWSNDSFAFIWSVSAFWIHPGRISTTIVWCSPLTISSKAFMCIFVLRVFCALSNVALPSTVSSGGVIWGTKAWKSELDRLRVSSSTGVRNASVALFRFDDALISASVAAALRVSGPERD